MRTCSRCKQQMRRTVVASIEVDECPTCKGLWFNDRELRLAKDKSDRDLAWMDFEIWRHREGFRVAAQPLRCPSCNSGMVAVQYGTTEVTVDYCTACRGVWLDKGEFQKIVRALADELTSKSAAEYVKASLQEARELLTGPESLLSEWRDLKAVLKLLQQRFFVEHPGFMSAIVSLPR